MGAGDPEQAILEHLAEPAGEWGPGQTSPGDWQSAVVRGGHIERPDLSTVRFVKHRRSEHRHLYFVSFDGTLPMLGPEKLSFHYVYPVEPDPAGGWRLCGGAGGGGGGPKRSTPWVNLGGGGWPDRFYAGGEVDGAGHEIAHVELHFANGVTLEDDSEAGVALFITDEAVALPGTAVLFDAAGAEVARHVPFPADLG